MQFATPLHDPKRAGTNKSSAVDVDEPTEPHAPEDIDAIGRRVPADIDRHSDSE